MQIVCYGCHGDMGANRVEATAEITVWYGMHDEWGCGAWLTQSELFDFSRRVDQQNRLPRPRPRAGRP